MEAKYFVANENTLGYLIEGNTPGFEQFGILHGNVLKGGFRDSDGWVFKSQCKILRPATIKDFKEYNVAVPPDFQGWQLKYNSVIP